MPGTQVTVSGVNFSGCSAQGNPAKPTAILTVKVGVASVDVPTAVPAGTGGFGAPTGHGDLAAEIALGVLGLGLVGAGGVAITRRRPRHQH